MFTQDWFTQNIPHWEKLLAEFKDRPYLKFLEIGCYEGRATKWLLDNILTNKRSQIMVIDTFEGSPENKEQKQNTKDILKNFEQNILIPKYQDQVTAIKGRSQLVLRTPIEATTVFYDFIYIVGSHKASDVLEDAVLAWRLLKEWGILIFDDYEWKAPYREIDKPKAGIDAFLKLYEGQYQILATGYQVAIRKITPLDIEKRKLSN
jgi:hypothetical protein